MDGQPDSMTFKQFHYKKSYLNQIKDGGDRKISPKNRNYAVENLFMRQHCHPYPIFDIAGISKILYNFFSGTWIIHKWGIVDEWLKE